ncbi:unnamed protein product [Schistosoma margrebowiei]|uniref:Uncharacterized protein n=1 Tax=Schistosoma margrebowiei TaxID=48269 RepID=A0A183L9A2_9TREM|nr:unnamed protein product [Schistosoma margrebowiei]
MRPKLMEHWTTVEMALQSFNIVFLQDTDKLNEFKITINNSFQALQDLLKKDVLFRKEHHHKEWISLETLDKIHEKINNKTAINNTRTRTENVEAQAEYTEANRQAKKSNRADKQRFVEDLETTMEEAEET